MKGNSTVKEKTSEVQKDKGTGIVSHTFPPVTMHRLQTALLLLPPKIPPTLSRTCSLAPRGLSSTIPEPLKALCACQPADMLDVMPLLSPPYAQMPKYPLPSA